MKDLAIKLQYSDEYITITAEIVDLAQLRNSENAYTVLDLMSAGF